MTNDEPDRKRLSEDRWRIWMINQNRELIRYTEKRMKAFLDWHAKKKRTNTPAVVNSA